MPIFKPRFNNQLTANSILSDDDVISFTSVNGTSAYLSAADALKNSDVYAVISQISSDLATTTFTTDSSRIQSMINNPAMTTNGHAFWQAMAAQMLLSGEAFAYRWRNVNGVDLRWEYLRPSQVSPFLLEDGSGLIYNVTFDEPSIGVVQAIPQSDMIHIRLLSQNGGMTGISPLSALSNELSIKDSSNKLTMNALNQSINAPGILKVNKGGLLNAEQKAKRSREFMRQQSKSSGGPIVIDDLEDYTSLEIKSDVASLLAQTDWTSKQIAKVYGMPDSLIGGQGDQQSSVAMMQGLYTNSLNRYAQAIVGELDNKLNSKITVNLRPALDPAGNNLATMISSLTKDGVLATNQATWMLQQSGYLDNDMPEAVQSAPLKGGEN